MQTENKDSMLVWPTVLVPGQAPKIYNETLSQIEKNKNE